MENDFEEREEDMMEVDAHEGQEGQEGQEDKGKKKKRLMKYHRIHAHRNPLNDGVYDYPVTPAEMNWSPYYPQLAAQGPLHVDFCDVGCGYGGLTVALGDLYKDKVTLGIEIRPKVVEYVEMRIQKLRALNPPQGLNISVMNTNAMKFLPNYFVKGQLEKLFFLFPDPHFKRSNHRRRIINFDLLAVYAYILKEGGKIYTITDVKELAEWMQKHLDQYPLFERISDEENAADPVVDLVRNSSEEAKKVDKSGGSKYLAVYRRIPDPNQS